MTVFFILIVPAFDQLVARHQGAEGDEVVGGDRLERVGANFRPSHDRANPVSVDPTQPHRHLRPDLGLGAAKAPLQVLYSRRSHGLARVHELVGG